MTGDGAELDATRHPPAAMTPVAAGAVRQAQIDVPASPMMNPSVVAVGGSCWGQQAEGLSGCYGSSTTPRWVFPAGNASGWKPDAREPRVQGAASLFSGADTS